MKSLKKISLIFLTALIIAALLLPVSATAAFEDFPDGVGHWAEPQLRRAVEDGLLKGYDDGLLHPNDPVTYSQILTLSCRMLKPVNSIEPQELGLTGDEWYAQAACQAAAMGVDIDTGALTEQSLPRADAFALICELFQLYEAEPDLTVLDRFGDTGSLTSAQARAMAAMVSQGYIEGYKGNLTPKSPITRAEFFTVLYRLAGTYSTGQDIPDMIEGGLVVSENGYIANREFTDPVWIDCSAKNVTLWNVTAGTVIFRSQASSISIQGSTDVDRLVIAGGAGNVSVMPVGTAKVGTLVIGTTDSTVTVSGNVERIQVTGDNVEASINGRPQDIVLDCSGSQITLSYGCSAQSLRFADASGNNSVVINGRADSLIFDGTDNTVSGAGSVRELTLISSTGSADIRYSQLDDQRTVGIDEASIELETVDILPPGETLKAYATVTNPYELTANAVWYVDGQAVLQHKVDVGQEPATLSLSYDYTYTRNMDLTSRITLELSYTNEDGVATEASRSVDLKLENYGDDYYKKSEEEVLAMVTSTYAGDYTLEWAESHDYEAEDKETWVNAKGYSSTSQYLLWINLTYQRVNVFQGSQGNWKLINTYIVGTGAPGMGTPVGVYTIFGRSPYGWTTSTYNVRPVVNFKVGSGYAFHSRLYDPGHNYLTSTAIGYPVSHGCVRMYDEDVQWIYDNVPNGTTVVVH